MSSANKRVTRLDSNYVREYDAYVERQNKRKKRLYRRLTLFAIVAVSVFAYLITFHLNQRELYKEKVSEYEQLNDELDKLEVKEKNLQQEIDLLNDTDYILQIARKDYFLSKDGEIIFNVPDDESSY
ncbi:septum formation initiator family protein [Virgibacillus sp. MSP4-1]|uniref:FtsB family cell division protein n=1 Tax=Virgibacillus sp. MSP4-1 TaxID=2700081 RepID=UPI0003A85473|nr:septum formation initiator family protein [Virgibacillus sp. MSP4-1]QHS23897.1 septum formation initiator family protein [Virgibacillus sp. MSP4-1]